jgi:hypothetical protein
MATGPVSHNFVAEKKDGNMPDPAIEASPPSTFGFGPRESADETRQAQQSVSNDAPTDVNYNAVIARAQTLTVTRMGDNFEAGANRRNILADHFQALIQAMNVKPG